MASKSSSLPQSSLATIPDEFEGLEVMEFDQNTLHELLYDPSNEVENNETHVQDMEVNKSSPGSEVDSYWFLDDIEKAQSFNWLEDMIEEASPLCNDVGAWYEGVCMEERNGFFGIGDYSLSHTANANMYDEIGYLGLWQEN